MSLPPTNNTPTNQPDSEQAEQPKKAGNALPISLPKPPAWLVGESRFTDSAPPEPPTPLEVAATANTATNAPVNTAANAPAPLPVPLPIGPPPNRPAPVVPPLPAPALKPVSTPTEPPLAAPTMPEVVPIKSSVAAPTDEPDSEADEDEAAEFESALDPFATSRLVIDPAFVYVVLVIVTAVGLSTLASDTRYVVVWSGLSLVGLAGLVLDKLPILRPSGRDLLLGITYGLVIGLPMFAVGNAQLRRLSFSIFGEPPLVPQSLVFLMVIFALPMAESLFFRGVFQNARGVMVTAVAASLWGLVLYAPNLNITAYPLVVVLLGAGFFAINFLYSYLAGRAGLFSAWACQITVSLLLFFAPRVF
jgi:hypothetical protein